VLASSQLPKTTDNQKSHVFTLQNGLGFIQKRTRTDVAVIRYPNISATLSPESYYHSILQLFLPYKRDIQLKPSKLETYEEFYNLSSVSCGANRKLQKVKSIEENNRMLYETDVDDLEAAEKNDG